MSIVQPCAKYLVHNINYASLNPDCAETTRQTYWQRMFSGSWKYIFLLCCQVSTHREYYDMEISFQYSKNKNGNIIL